MTEAPDTIAADPAPWPFNDVRPIDAPRPIRPERPASLPTLLDLAQRIRSVDPAAAWRLEDLNWATQEAAAGGPGTNLDGWTAEDVRTVIAPDALVERMRRGPEERSWLLAGLDWLRAGLFFAPLLITWYGIWTAASHFRSIPPSHQQQTFLWAWENQFFHNIRPTLSDLALIDLFALGSILVVSVLIHAIANFGQVQRERTADRFAADLYQALGDATLALARYRVRPADMAGRLDEVIGLLLKQIGEERARLQTLTERVHADFAALGKVSRGFQEGVDKFLKAGDRLQQAQIRLQALLERAAPALERLADSQQRLVESGARTNRHLDTLARRQTEASGLLAATVLQMTRFLAELTTAAQELTTAVGVVDDAGTEARATNESLQEFTENGRVDMTNLLERSVELADAMNAQVDILQEITPILKTAADDLLDGSQNLKGLTVSRNGSKGAASPNLSPVLERLALASERQSDLLSRLIMFDGFAQAAGEPTVLHSSPAEETYD
jgi:hypothetical protein